MVDAELLNMHAVALGIAAHADATLAEEYGIIESTLAECVTVADWQDCLDAFGERDVGSFVADWQDGMALNDAWGEGIAYLTIDDENAIVAEWDNLGFWSVSFTTPDEAAAAVDGAYPDDDDMGNDC